MNEGRADIEMVGWDRDTRKNTPDAVTTTLSIVPLPSTRTLSLNKDNESDSNYPKALLGHKGIKFNVANLTKLSYDSDLAKYVTGPPTDRSLHRARGTRGSHSSFHRVGMFRAEARLGDVSADDRGTQGSRE